MKEETAQEKTNNGRRIGPEEEETWKKNRPRRKGNMEEEPAQEKRTDGRSTGQEKKRDGRKPGPGEEEE